MRVPTAPSMGADNSKWIDLHRWQHTFLFLRSIHTQHHFDLVCGVDFSRQSFVSFHHSVHESEKTHIDLSCHRLNPIFSLFNKKRLESGLFLCVARIHLECGRALLLFCDRVKLSPLSSSIILCLLCVCVCIYISICGRPLIRLELSPTPSQCAVPGQWLKRENTTAQREKSLCVVERVVVAISPGSRVSPERVPARLWDYCSSSKQLNCRFIYFSYCVVYPFRRVPKKNRLE